MALRNGETRRGSNLDRASEMSLGGDVFEDTAPPFVLQAQKLAHRLGCSAAVARLVVGLSGLGPREERR